MGTLATELGPFAQRITGPRIYADANLPSGVVTFMRQRLGWDVFYVLEHEDLRRARDVVHYRTARQLRRTLVTIDRDYLDDGKFPPEESGGVLVVWAPNELLLTRTLREVDRRLFQTSESELVLPLAGRKLVVDPAWAGDTPR
jgi:Domain of unknown function (DUF5615)